MQGRHCLKACVCTDCNNNEDFATRSVEEISVMPSITLAIAPMEDDLQRCMMDQIVGSLEGEDSGVAIDPVPSPTVQNKEISDGIASSSSNLLDTPRIRNTTNI